jgi:hypothetical protein
MMDLGTWRETVTLEANDSPAGRLQLKNLGLAVEEAVACC